MDIYFKHCRIRETRNCKGPWVNTATALYKGTLVTLDRDRTEYTIYPDGTCDMIWKNAYIWDGEKPEYFLNPFAFSKVTGIEVEDDADKGYVFGINTDSVVFS